MIIAVEGGIGVGKTTAATALAEKLSATLLLERTEAHPFLDAFYENPSRFALETELGFVLLHYHQLHPADPSSMVVTDFSPVKDLAFARMNLSGAALDLFEHVYGRLTSTLPQPGLAVYLDMDTNEALRRIRLRDRPYERSITVAYLDKLHEAYTDLMDELATTVRRVSVLATDSREVVIQKVLEAVRQSRVLE